MSEIQNHKHPVVLCFPFPSLPPPLLCPPKCGCELSVCSGGGTRVAPTDLLSGCENQGLALAPALPEGSQQFQSILAAQLGSLSAAFCLSTKFLLGKCNIHEGDTLISKPSAPCFGMWVGGVTSGIRLKSVWYLGAFDLQELVGPLKSTSKARWATHNFHVICFLSVTLGHARTPHSQAGFPWPPEQTVGSWPPAFRTGPVVPECILSCWQSSHQEIHYYLGLGDGSCSGETYSQIALCLEVKGANPSYAASQQLCVALPLSPAWRNVTVSGWEFWASKGFHYSLLLSPNGMKGNIKWKKHHQI